jgi:hypothetical protein
MNARWRHALAAYGLVAGVALSASAGCAKDPTSVFVTISADADVPPVLALRNSIARADDPGGGAISEQVSIAASDAADRPGPYVFPLVLSLSVAPSYAGPVIVTIEGLDWDTGAVNARGSTPATVAAQQTTSVSLTLAAVPLPPRDGGTD